MSNRFSEEGIDKRPYATWCEFCDRPATVCAEHRSGRAVDVCDINRHGKVLTGNYRKIRRILKQ